MTTVQSEIDWYPLSAVNELCGSESTRRRWASLMRGKTVGRVQGVVIPEFDQSCGDRIVTKESYKVYQYLAWLMSQNWSLEKALHKIRNEGIPDD